MLCYHFTKDIIKMSIRWDLLSKDMRLCDDLTEKTSNNKKKYFSSYLGQAQETEYG